MAIISKNFFVRFFNLFPVIILFYLTLSEVNFHFTYSNFLSFNLIYIFIFYWVLKKPEILGYGFIFLAGIVNDVVIGLPIGVSSVTYLILSGFAAYIRHLTVQPSLIYDWIVFIPSIAVTNSLYFYILGIFFKIDIDYIALVINSGMTILLYPIIGIILNIITKMFTFK
tara:strand:+ start:37 stop:543 length:507 start_codon:yes stop_codon:yes gene_type:complete